MKQYDVLIIGGGPAGFSAALILGRCRRSVVICDHHRPRNASSRAMHGYLTRDGIPPADFLATARKELAQYGTQFRDYEAIEARPVKNIFEVILRNGEHLFGKKLLLATGMRDILPQLKNIMAFYGKSVFHCPYCDGWERRNQPIAVYGKNRKGASLALTMVQWSSHITLCTDGEKLSDKYKLPLAKHHIDCREEPIECLEGSNGQLHRITFKNGASLNVNALFFNTEKGPQSDIAEKLGCHTQQSGDIKTDDLQKTGIPSVYVAGDAADDLKLVILAAAEGAKAAFAINTDLMNEEIASLPD